MSVYHIDAAANGFTQQPSTRGVKPWTTASATLIRSSIGPSNGTNWAIWSVHIPSANPNETLDSVRFRGGHDYTVNQPGLGTRIVTLGVGYRHSVAAFTNTGDAIAIGSRTGNGTGAAIDIGVDASPFGVFTSNDLRAGSFFVGMLAFTDGADSTWPSDVYNMGVLTWDIYTQGTTPAPPVGEPSIRITNPIANINPGKYAGIEQFASVNGAWVSNGLPARNYLTFKWVITPPTGGGGVTFSNGTTQLTQQKGYAGGPTNWDNADTGPMSIANTAVPGVYTLTLTITSGDGDGRFVYGSTQLLVIYPGYMTTEF